MYKKGDKVVPHTKTPIRPLGESYQWGLAKENMQSFLYVIGHDKDDNLWCAYSSDSKVGDLFSNSDLTHYIEPKTDRVTRGNPTFLRFVEQKFSNYKVKDLIKLYNDGILKDEDELIVGRK